MKPFLRRLKDVHLSSNKRDRRIGRSFCVTAARAISIKDYAPLTASHLNISTALHWDTAAIGD